MRKMKTFPWWNTVERGLWTGVQAPAGVAVADLVVSEASMPAAAYWISAAAAIAISVVKTLAAARLRWLDTA